MKKKILFYFITVHLCLILMICIASSIHSYDQFYNSSKKDYEPTKIESALVTISSLPVIYHYLKVAGIDAGYGFFAPNVASGYLIQFVHKDELNNKLDSTFIPSFKDLEGLNRYNTLLANFQDKLKAIEKDRNGKSLYTRYLDVIIKSIGRNIIMNDTNGDLHYLTATLYLYNFPSLKEYSLGNHQQKLLLVESFDVFKKEH